VYLRHAAQTVWILNSGIPITMGFPDLAVSEELTKKAGRSGLSGLAASLVDAVIERYRRAHQRIERHRSGNMSCMPEIFCIPESKRSDCGVSLRTVDQRDSFFRTKLDRLQSIFLQDSRGIRC